PDPHQGVSGGQAGTAGRSARLSERRAGWSGCVTFILASAAMGFFATLLGTPLAIRLFRLWWWGQRIREDGPQGHMEKMGTPTMGGIVILAGMVIAYLVARVEFQTFTSAGAAVLGMTLGLGLLGATDDFLKIRHRRSLGLIT